jgi:hypothetical protein
MSGGGTGNAGWQGMPRAELQRAAYAFAIEGLKAPLYLNGAGATAAIALLGSAPAALPRAPLGIGAVLFACGLIVATLALWFAFRLQEDLAAKGTLAGADEENKRECVVRLVFASLALFALGVVSCAVSGGLAS